MRAAAVAAPPRRPSPASERLGRGHGESNSDLAAGLASVGVARVSWGPFLHLDAMARFADAELGEYLAQVVFDSARADEQLGADLRVRVPLGSEPGDLRLLRGELVGRLD